MFSAVGAQNKPPLTDWHKCLHGFCHTGSEIEMHILLSAMLASKNLRVLEQQLSGYPPGKQGN